MTATPTVEIDLPRWLQASDLVVIEQGIGEPCSLVEALVRDAPRLHGVRAFAGVSYSGLITEAAARSLELTSFGAMATLSPLARAGVLGVIPCHYADVSRALRARAGRDLVVMVQLSPADEDGYHSFGVALDYTHDLLAEARIVLAEINDQMPAIRGPRVHRSALAATVKVSRPLPEVPAPATDDVHRAIAASVEPLIPDGAALQLGIGGVPSVVAKLLSSRRGLRVHSALVGDWLLELAQAGALEDAPGAVVLSGAAGSSALYEYLAEADVEFLPIPALSPPQVLARVPRLVAINSALQVDLSGQINAESIGDRYVGGVGGQLDFLGGAQLSDGGVGIVVLPATAKRGTLSRVVPELDRGVVSTPRSCVDIVVTEHGIADLRGRDLSERAAALTAIAAPEHRDRLVAHR